MAKFALLELHVDEASITANAPFSGSSDRDSGEVEEVEVTEEEQSSEGRGMSVGPMVGIAALAVGIFLLRRLLQGGTDESERQTDLTVLP